MPASEEQALLPGTVIDSFRVESVLGVGGFGITYRARDLSLEREVALKEYFPSGLAARKAQDTTLEPCTRSDHEPFSYGLKRFLDEARTLAMFQDRNIVRVNSFLEANGTAYLVMDYEDGRTLADVLRQLGRLRRKQALAVVVHILRGLRAVHAKRVLHRDIKPANVFIRRSGPPLLLDFGAARQALERRAGDVTVMLTPGYAPIEQYGGDERLGPWSDIYALGATAYHGVTGRAPRASTQRVTMVHDGKPDPVQVAVDMLADELGPTLARALSWMLQLNANDRPQSADELLELLLPGRADTSLRPAEAGAAPASSAFKTTAPSGSSEGPEPSGASPAAAFEREQLEAAEHRLAEFLGPIAKILVERAAGSASSVEELYRSLAEELDDDEERRRFLSSQP
jgi:serine/threonine protein kinase